MVEGWAVEIHALGRTAANGREKIDCGGLGQWDSGSSDRAGFPGKAMFDEVPGIQLEKKKSL